MMFRANAFLVASLICLAPAIGQAPVATETVAVDADLVVPVWPDQPPTWDAPTEPEQDTSGDNGRDVAGKRVIRLGHVSTPQLHIYRPANHDTGTVVVVCPGGGYSILAWDLEGTEIAKWFQSIGITAAVLKYRVPTGRSETPWLAPVQDVQRSISLIRGGNVEGVQATQIGVMGFSAGGNAAARAALATQRFYEPLDDADHAECTPDFSILVYPAWLVKKDAPNELIDEVKVTSESPAMFFAHASDDRVTAMSSVTLYSELKRNGIDGSLHIFASGGHGFGGRIAGQPTDAWRGLCETWLKSKGWLAQ
ncbi:MAG: alpha/beta hydrolase fold domain-containing protein [Rubripirellula sp.]